MVHAQTFLQHFVLGGDHVVVIVVGEACVHAVARLARFSVSDVIGKDDEVTIDVEKLSRSEEHSCKLRSQELVSASTGAVKNQDGIVYTPIRITLRPAKSCVVESQFMKSLARTKMKVMRDVIAFVRSRKVAGWVRLLTEAHGWQKKD